MKKILVVEDDSAIRESLQELLESEGYAVTLAEHGEAALKSLSEKDNIQLILLDLSMPVMDGKTFLKKFTSTFPELSTLPILIMTAAGPGEIPLQYSRSMILRKPLDVDELLEKIEKSIV